MTSTGLQLASVNNESLEINKHRIRKLHSASGYRSDIGIDGVLSTGVTDLRRQLAERGAAVPAASS